MSDIPSFQSKADQKHAPNVVEVFEKTLPLGYVKSGNGLLLGHAWKILKEDFQAIPSFQIIDERSNRNPRACKDREALTPFSFGIVQRGRYNHAPVRQQRGIL